MSILFLGKQIRQSFAQAVKPGFAGRGDLYFGRFSYIAARMARLHQRRIARFTGAANAGPFNGFDDVCDQHGST